MQLISTHPVSSSVLKDLLILGGRIKTPAGGPLGGRVQTENKKCRWERRDPEETSCLGSHLPRDQEIDLTPVIFVIGQAFVHLGFGNLGKAVRNDGIDTLAILQEANTSWTPMRVPSITGWPPRTFGIRVM